MSETCSSSHSAFFYGTLMAPSVLHRVTRRPLDQPFRVCPAVLPGFKRHRVKDADYPALLPANDEHGNLVQGTYVQGLTDIDMFALDVFEGDEYERRKVLVEILDDTKVAEKIKVPQDFETGEREPNPVHKDMLTDPKPPHDTANAEVYVWIKDISYLEEDGWDFNEFLKEKLHMWAPSSQEYQEVDQAFEAMSVEKQRNSIDKDKFKSFAECHGSGEDSEIARGFASGIGWRQDDPTGGRNINTRVFEAKIGSTK